MKNTDVFRWGDYAVMNEQRWHELGIHGGSLTADEIKEGWHFCPDWDCLLICKDWPEMSGCTCKLARK